ncbi:uncharacterized protein LOC110436210 [Sorghum bicolor]|uniref:uncharacterized protein LOC110436210 n=1 Tax=Sorghum bicolor TaxID=4558 RepID=UPI000B424051|nr:uncharacterized protein LOC110436210 [Sorghum bicolor]|eukprot:XP_021318327.1 uncharacterized protein LOC110436210 [Sorghum bicolor]
MAPPFVPPSALVASSSIRSPTPSMRMPLRPQQAAGGQQSGNGRGRRCRGRGQGGQHGGATGGQQGGSSGGQPWPSILNPWTGSIHMWPGSTPGGPRGQPPRAILPTPSQQPLLAGVPHAYINAPSAPGSYYQAPQAPTWSPWTPEYLANAFSTVSLTPPPTSLDWVIDSGASSHIASNPGSPYQGHPPSM